jgi:hypothetical protein
MQVTSISLTQVSYSFSTNNDDSSAPFATYAETLEHGLKQPVCFAGACGIFSFTTPDNNSAAQISMTAENISRFKKRFGSEIADNGDNQYCLSGKAEKYMNAFWEYFKEKQPDSNSDGYINFEEYKNSSSLLIGYDEENNAPITTKISSGLSDECLNMFGINKCTFESVDQAFNDLLTYDENIDGIISKCEIGKGVSEDFESRAKSLDPDSLFYRCLLQFINEKEEEEEKKTTKQNEQLDIAKLRFKIDEAIDALPNIKTECKLTGLLQNLKTSLK